MENDLKLVDHLKEFDFEELFNQYNRIICIGPSQTGKSNLCYHMVYTHFINDTDIFLVYSKNQRTLNRWEEFFEELDFRDKCVFIKESEAEVELTSILNNIENSEHHHLTYTLILDDVLGSSNSKSSKIKKESIMNLLMNQSRHLNMHLLLSIQSSTGIPPSAYSSATMTVLFKDQNYYNYQHHYYEKLFGSIVYQLGKSGLITGRHKSEICDLMFDSLMEMKPFNCLAIYRNVKTQKTNLYLISKVPNYWNERKRKFEFYEK